MNCKQGDLARVVPDEAEDEWSRGIIVRCVRPSLYNGRPAWIIEPELTDPKGRVVDGCEDCILRPINKPGDDAVDESLLWLPVPVKETA